ncbi:hypothetical protein [Methanohalophilus sp.]|uniref:hypothetical protein n=1 Tax=Methanohalophilus sp. TaxID=1966352 RepID=UPI0026157BE5|nr:hypothetical protein [Methanohalophilus sp.]MDK2892232.1 hypothetical protein [Methanohalophilus sp.]
MVKVFFQKTIDVIKELINFKNNLIILKITFFNTIYDLFSVYIVWICFIGFFHLTNLYRVEISNETTFFQITALVGLLLGIFQFILQRNDEKLLAKINHTGKMIDQIINRESSFEKFYDSIPDVKPNKVLKKWIQNTIDPKLQMRDFFMFMLGDEDTRKLLFKHIDKTPISINLSYNNSSQKFERLDIEAKRNHSRRKDLHKAYNKFFVNESRIDEIIDIISNEINLNDFRLVALSNINIISESIPQFTNNHLLSMVEELMSDSKKYDSSNIEFESANGYIQYLHYQVSIRIMDKILS